MFTYINGWQDAVLSQPMWLKPHLEKARKLMVARVAAASKYRGKCKQPEKPILMGCPEESPPHLPHSRLCDTVQIREFLGASGFRHSWIPNYSLLAKPLYEATKRGENRKPWYGEGEKSL
jgi:hypothetical protein